MPEVGRRTKRGIQYSQEAPHGQKRLPNWAVSPGKSAREIHFALQGLSEAMGEAQLHFASLRTELRERNENINGILSLHAILTKTMDEQRACRQAASGNGR